MKKIFFCLIILIDGFLPRISAQQNSEAEIKKIFSARIDSFLNVFMQASELKKPGTDVYSEEVARTYESYFLPDAKVYYEMAPALLDGDRDYPFFLKFSSLKNYISKIKTYYPAGLNQNLIQYAVDYSKLNSGSFNLILQKTVLGTSSNGYEFKNSDTINIEIKAENNLSEFKIIRILNLGSEFSILNDKDNDLVIDANDKCPDVAGTFSDQGCPPSAENRASSYIGIQFNYGISENTTIDGPKKAGLGYNSIIDPTFKMSPVTVDDNNSNRYGVTLQYDRFFGRKRIFGGSIGVSYQYFETELNMQEFFVEFHDIDKFGNDYRRVVRSKSVIAEKIKMSSLMIPLTIKFKKKLFSKGGIFVDAGVAFSLLLSGSGKANASFNYEAIYKLDNSLPTPKFIYDTNVTPGISDWLIQEDFVNSLNGNNAAATNSYFVEQKSNGFDVAVKKEVDQSSDFKLNPAVVLLFSGGFYYTIFKNAEVNLGVLYMSESKSKDNSSGYKLTDKTGEYSSIVNGSDKLDFQSIGIVLGLKFSLK